MRVLGQRIRQARERRDLSQEEFAALIARDQRAVSEYENGKRKIAVTDLPLFARVLGMPLAYFYEDALDADHLDAALLLEFHRLPNAQMKQSAIDLLRVFSDALAT